MATSSRAESIDVRRTLLGKALLEHPGRFNFFQAVRLLERLRPGRVAVGRFGPPEREAMRFGINNSLAFPPSQIHSLDWADGGMPKMTVNFMGLTGPNGVLPYSFTELIRERNRTKDRTMQDFLDLFNHRAISLFYQAWEKYRFFVAYERDQQDRFSNYVMSFAGLGTKGLQKRFETPERTIVHDETFLFYSGLLSLQPKSAAALEQILCDYFGVPVEIDQFIGAWHSISTADQCCFEAGYEFSEQLGIGAVAGDEIWDHQSRVRIKLGPLTLEQYLDFLPVGQAYEPLSALLKFFAGDEFEFEAQLLLKREEVPAVQMESQGDSSTFLGWTTWMKSGPSFGRNPGDTILLLN